MGRTLSRRDERHDGAIVRLVRRDIEHRHALDGRDGVADLFDDIEATAFGKIRDALNQLHDRSGFGFS